MTKVTRKTRPREEQAFDRLRGRPSLAVLGIDPGTRALGWAILGRREREVVWVDHGIFRAPASEPIEERLLRLGDALDRCIEHHRPDAVAMEEAFFHKNPQSALRIGEARGAVLLLAARHGLPTIQYPTATAKRAVTGHGGSTKEGVRLMIQQELGLELDAKEHDATDALALALCLLHDHRLHHALG